MIFVFFSVNAYLCSVFLHINKEEKVLFCQMKRLLWTMALLLTLGNVARAEKWSDSWLDHCAAQFSSIDETNKVINITSEGELALWVAKAKDHVNGSNATYAGWTINLTKDLDMTGHNWEPLWRFAGVFDGHGHTISNLYVEKHPEHN